MNRYLAFFLKEYDFEDKELILKAKFALITILCVTLLMLLLLIPATYLYDTSNFIVITELIGFFVMIAALGMLVKGYYDIAIHTLLIAGFATVWIILLVAPTISILTKMDTIVYIVGLLAVMPLMFFKSRKPMLVYFLANLFLLLVFNIYLTEAADLTAKEHVDYFIDNSVAMTFVFFVSFTLFSIYKQTLVSLKRELDEKEKTEKALQASERKLLAHLENTPVGAVSLDEDFGIVGWNPSAERIFGYSAGEAVGGNIIDFIVPVDLKEHVTKVFSDLLSGKGGKRNINENITKQGDRITCDWYNTVIHDKDGEIIGITSLVNDITEQKKTEALMIQTEKMMSIGGLAAGMAHEINNPLAGMMQNAQVIYNRLTRDLPANDIAAEESGVSMTAIRSFMEKRGILTQLENINQAGDRAAKIINNMLSFVKNVDSERTGHNMAELIENTIELAKNDYDLKKKYDFKHIKIIREYSPDIPPVLCEQSKIQQVIFNILKNASEAMSENKLQKNEPEITIRLEQQSDKICIEIQDNGPGIYKETRKRIFEPFFTTKDVDKGTGLGLFVSYFIIVNDHAGEISVESSLGKGAKFIIRLPI